MKPSTLRGSFLPLFILRPELTLDPGLLSTTGHSSGVQELAGVSSLYMYGWPDPGIMLRILGWGSFQGKQGETRGQAKHTVGRSITLCPHGYCLHPPSIQGIQGMQSWVALCKLRLQQPGDEGMVSPNHTFTSSSQEQGPCFSLCPSRLSSLLLPLPLSPALISRQTHKEGERRSRDGGACWDRWDMGRADAGAEGRRPSPHPLRSGAAQPPCRSHTLERRGLGADGSLIIRRLVPAESRGRGAQFSWLHGWMSGPHGICDPLPTESQSWLARVLARTVQT